VDYPEQALLASIVQNWCAWCVFTILPNFELISPFFIGCLSLMNDLDRPSVNHSHEHTDTLMEGLTLKELWDDFGIVGDLIVSPEFIPLTPGSYLLAAIHYSLSGC
jgi:hypothetical protein